MANVDWSDVKAEWDRTPPEYETGQNMVITVSGQAKVGSGEPVVTTETVLLTAEIKSASGATSTITALPATVIHTEPGGEIVLEDVTLLSITDDSGRTWTVDGNTATAVA